MAAGDFYVDNAAGADTNGGTSAGAAIVSGTAAATNGTTTVDLSGDTPDLSGVSVGDCIRLAGETGGRRSGDIFEITAVDDGADTVTVSETPGTADPVVWAIGGAWATLQKSADTVLAADTDKVWIKGGTDYTETWNFSLVMGNLTPATFEGYTTATGDDGIFTINGEASRANGMTDSITGLSYYIFKNMRVTNHTSHGLSLSMDFCSFKNCQFDNNSGHGVLIDDLCKFEDCDFSDNTTDGIDADTASAFIGCRAYRNGGDGIECRTGLMFGCVAYSNGGHGLAFSGQATAFNIMINCTVDGDAKDTNTGVRMGPSFAGLSIMINNIIYDCGTGIDIITGQGELNLSRNNLLNSNTADYAGGGATFKGEVTGAPQFSDEGSQDYTLASGSPAKGTGFDESQLEGDSSGIDMGARQRIEAGGGGGLLMPNKRGGKQ